MRVCGNTKSYLPNLNHFGEEANSKKKADVFLIQGRNDLVSDG